MRLKGILGSIGIALAVAVTSVSTVALPAAAQSPEQSACEGSGGTWSGTWPNGTCTHGPRTVTGTIKSVGNIVVFLTGAIAVLMIIIGAIRYTISNGDQGAITSAKNTILYAVVGLILSVAAYAIVNFVLSNV